MVHHCTSGSTGRSIERTTPPAPTEPEDRITGEIVLLKAIVDDPARRIPPHRRRAIERRLAELDEELAEWIPTSYRPDPNRRGGK